MAYNIEQWLGTLSNAEDPSTAARKNALRAERAEIARRERLDSEIAKIAAAFHGTKATGVYDWKKFAGNINKKDPKNAWDYGAAGGGLPDNFVNMVGPDGKTMGILDLATAKWYKPGQQIVYTPEGAKVTGADPFGKEFYDKYKGAMSGYYLPDVRRQYGDAQKEATYRLAGAGTLKSSAANDLSADLARQKLENDAAIANKVTTAAGTLREDITRQENDAIARANAASNPETAVSTALSTAEQLRATQPELSPLGEIFKIAAIGAASGIGGYQSGRTTADALALRNKYNKDNYGTTVV